MISQFMVRDDTYAVRDTDELAQDNEGIRADFDYEVVFKWTSHCEREVRLIDIEPDVRYDSLAYKKTLSVIEIAVSTVLPPV